MLRESEINGWASYIFQYICFSFIEIIATNSLFVFVCNTSQEIYLYKTPFFVTILQLLIVTLS